MSALFEIVGEFQALYDIATAEDVDPQTFADTLESLTGELEVKSAGYVAVLNQLQMEMDRADELKKKFEAMKKTRENSIKRMKERLRDALIAIDKKEVQAGDFKIVLKNNGGLQPLKITGNVPENMTKVEIKNDEKKIREFLASPEGKACEWAHLEERGQHIEIK